MLKNNNKNNNNAHTQKKTNKQQNPKPTLFKVIPFMWMHGQALPEPWAGLSNMTQGKTKREKGLEGSRGYWGQRVDVRGVQQRRSEEKDTSDNDRE